MFKRLISLILCLTTFSFPESGSPSPQREEETTPTNTPPVTYLAPNASFEGTLKSEGDVEIRGKFDGELSCQGHLLLCTNFHGDLSCDSIVILGSTVVGNINTNTIITLDRESAIIGNTQSEKLVCAGKIRGNLNIKNALTLTSQSDVEGDITTQTLTMDNGAIFKGNIKMPTH